jgi:UDP-N-acetylmuramate dehydrogenase
VTRAELQLQPGERDAVRERARQARERRLAALPAEPSAGSVFRNPPGDFAGRLLEQAGCKGLRYGGAAVSTKHANVIVNPGGATAADVRALIREMARRVREESGIRLMLELKVLKGDGTLLTEPEAV